MTITIKAFNIQYNLSKNFEEFLRLEEYFLFKIL